MRFVLKHRLWLFPWVLAALLAGGPRYALAGDPGHLFRTLRQLDADDDNGRVVIIRNDDDPIVIRDRHVIRDRNVIRHRIRDRHRIVITDPSGRVFVSNGPYGLNARIRAQVDRMLALHLGQQRRYAWRGSDPVVLRVRDRVNQRVRERVRDDRRYEARERTQRRAEIRREVRELQQEIKDLEEQLEETP